MAIICIVIVLVIFAADMFIKNKIEQDANLPRKLWKGRICVERYHNTGAALNFFHKKQKLVAVISVLLTLFTLVLLIATFAAKGNNLLKAGLALILGGAFSNTYDRLRRKYVVDYVRFPIKWKRLANIVFNISDFCIIAGALICCLSAE